MGKYFLSNSEILNYDMIDNLTTNKTDQIAMPKSAPQVHEPLDNSKKEFLSKTNNIPDLDEKIEEISEQNQVIKEHFNKIEKERVKQTFKSFDELEVLERLNQITFLLIQQNNRISNIENFLKKNFSSSSISQAQKNIKMQDNEQKLNLREKEIQQVGNVEELTPVQRHIQESVENEKIDYTNIEHVKKELGKIKSSKSCSIPDEGYIDNSIKLEEIFPGRDPEAYQAAYQTMEEIRKNNPNLGYSKSPKGGFNASDAGF